MIDDLLVEPVTFSLECRSQVGVPSDLCHSVTIHRDWSVTTGHDLEAERIASALGSVCSCIDLVDYTVPKVRGLYPLISRARRPRLVRERSGWAVAGPDRDQRCCNGIFPTADAAMAHLTSGSHASTGGKALEWQLQAVLTQVKRGHLVRALDQYPNAASYVSEITGVDELWNSGLHPRDLPELAAAARAAGECFPVDYFLSRAYGSVDPAWISAVLPARPDPDTAAWLARLPMPDRFGTTDAWRRWLARGIPRDQVLAAMSHGLSPALPDDAARRLGTHPDKAASVLVAFASADLPLTERHLDALGAHGVTNPLPYKPTVTELVQDLVTARPRIRRELSHTDLSVMVNLLGNRAAVINALHATGDPLDPQPNLNNTRSNA